MQGTVFTSTHKSTILTYEWQGKFSRLPQKALVRAETQQEADELMAFFDANGAYWFARGIQCKWAAHLWERFGPGTCYCLSRGKRVGYAHINWFREHREYECKNYRCWNFCTVHNFIEMCGDLR